ncbi:MAG: hypothetical protein ACYDAP_13130 [Thermoplasmataceae archaeon]|jgi:hypothetical protein
MVIRHQNSLEKQEVKEIITLVNEGKDPITEIYFEMEEFRNELNVTDDQGNIVPFLTKEALKHKLVGEIKAQLENDKKHICGIVFHPSGEIRSGEYKILELSYNLLGLETEVTYDNPLLSVYTSSNFYLVFSFFGDETVSLSLDFEAGISADDGLFIICRDKDGEDILDYNVEEKFHYNPSQRNITLSISARKRKEKEIQSVLVLYSVVPDKEVRTLIGSITLFSILFPILIVAVYLRFKNLSLFGIMSTTELLSIVSLGIAEFPSILVSVKRRLILSMVELFLVFIIILIPQTWISEVWDMIIHHI